MKIINIKKWAVLLTMTATAFILFTQPLTARISDYLKECPWIGLIANEITYGPITVSNVHVHDGDKLAFVVPGETLNGSLKYKIKAKDLSSLHLYHLIIGIKGVGAQECVTHNLGVWNTKGKGRFNLKAPLEKGIYEVRFQLTEGLTCEEAQNVWNSGQETPNSSATIGVIIVE